MEKEEGEDITEQVGDETHMGRLMPLSFYQLLAIMTEE